MSKLAASAMNVVDGVTFMNKEAYEKVISFIRSSKWLTKGVWGLSKVLPLLMAALYCAGCLVLIIMRHSMTFKFLAVPAFVFIFVTIFRKIINRKRPYDALEYQPLLSYEPGKGKSFPSRHTASAFVIAFAFWWICPWIGILLTIGAAGVAISRVVAGMHYISDVLAGLTLSLVSAFLGYYLLP